MVRCKLKANQGGFTLIELMVALVIGLIVSAGLVQLFIMIKKTNDQVEVLSERQEVVRYVSEMIMVDVRTSEDFVLTPYQDPDDVWVDLSIGRDCGLTSLGEEADVWGGESRLMLFIDYTKDSGSVRRSDPYCGSSADLKEISYFSSFSSDGWPSLMKCYLCEGASRVVSNVEDGVELGFSSAPGTAAPSVEMEISFPEVVTGAQGDNIFIFNAVSRTPALAP